MARGWTPSLRTVLVTVSLVILLLPLGGIVLFRLYESVQVRRTEAELLAQGAVLVAVYREELRRRLDPATGYGSPVERTSVKAKEEDWQPLLPGLDLARDPVLPDALPPRRAGAVVRQAAVDAGAVISPLMREVQRSTLAGIRVTDDRGTIVATTSEGLGLSLAHREEIQRALRGEAVRLMRERSTNNPRPALDSISRSTKLRVFVALPVLEGDRVWGVVVLSRTPMSVLQSLYGIRGYLITGGIVLLLIVLGVTLFTSATIARPVEELIRRTDRIARNDPTGAVPLERPGTLEIKRLSEAFVRMARALKDRGDYIATFATNVSHEFKTPLTAMRGAVELLRDHANEMTEEERDRFLENLHKDTHRLERLVNRLLELARADVIRPTDASSRVKPVVERCVQQHVSPDHDLELDCDEDLRVAVAEEMLDTVLSNLVANAVQHGGDGSRIRIEAGPEDGFVRFRVVNDGKGISPGNLPRVFDRFFTTARDTGGSGLGLAIVKTLVEAHGGTVSVESGGGTTVFQLHLPAG